MSVDNPFDVTETIEYVSIPDDASNYGTVDGVLFSKDLKKLIFYPPGRKAYG